MTASPDNANIMLQQYCNHNFVKEDRNTLYTCIPIYRMIYATNSAAALAATAKATSNNIMAASTLAPISSNKLESSGFGTPSRSLELTNNTNTLKKLAINIDSLMTSKERKSSISSGGLVSHRTTFPDKKSVKLIETERVKGEEGLMVDRDDIYDSQNGYMGKDEEEKTLQGERLFTKYSITPNFAMYATLNGDEASFRPLFTQKPLLRVTYLQLIQLRIYALYLFTCLLYTSDAADE